MKQDDISDISASDDLLLCVARIMVALHMGYGSHMYQPELEKLVQAFNESNRGKFMHLGEYAFDGDRANAMKGFIEELINSEGKR